MASTSASVGETAPLVIVPQRRKLQEISQNECALTPHSENVPNSATSRHGGPAQEITEQNDTNMITFKPAHHEFHSTTQTDNNAKPEIGSDSDYAVNLAWYTDDKEVDSRWLPLSEPASGRKELLRISSPSIMGVRRPTSQTSMSKTAVAPQKPTFHRSRSMPGGDDAVDGSLSSPSNSPERRDSPGGLKGLNDLTGGLRNKATTAYAYTKAAFSALNSGDALRKNSSANTSVFEHGKMLAEASNSNPLVAPGGNGYRHGSTLPRRSPAHLLNTHSEGALQYVGTDLCDRLCSPVSSSMSDLHVLSPITSSNSQTPSTPPSKQSSMMIMSPSHGTPGEPAATPTTPVHNSKKQPRARSKPELTATGTEHVHSLFAVHVVSGNNSGSSPSLRFKRIATLPLVPASPPDSPPIASPRAILAAMSLRQGRKIYAGRPTSKQDKAAPNISERNEHPLAMTGVAVTFSFENMGSIGECDELAAAEEVEPELNESTSDALRPTPPIGKRYGRGSSNPSVRLHTILDDYHD